jgi:hypothetical protein
MMQGKEIPLEYRRFASVFEKKVLECLPERRSWDHAIKMKLGFKSKVSHPYPLSQTELKRLDDWLDKQLAKGYIRPLKSSQASGFVFIEKKAKGGYRPCQDYCYLNEWTVKDAYPLTLISDLLLRLRDAKYFTKLDLHWGYNNVWIKEGDEHLAAFNTNRGMFEPLVMFFRLCNSLATFQRMMNTYFQDMITKGWIVMYMDDILILGKTEQELENHMKQVLQCLNDNDLFLKLEKCKFKQKVIKFLGLIISENQIWMDAAKLAGIKQWPEPTKLKELHSLGFANFYRRFIGYYAEIVKPLTNLTWKDIEYRWTKDQQKGYKQCFEVFPGGKCSCR